MQRTQEVLSSMVVPTQQQLRGIARIKLHAAGCQSLALDVVVIDFAIHHRDERSIAVRRRLRGSTDKIQCHPSERHASTVVLEARLCVPRMVPERARHPVDEQRWIGRKRLACVTEDAWHEGKPSGLQLKAWTRGP